MAKPTPYDFVFDYLPPGIIVKPMFGFHYIYWGKKLMLILCTNLKHPEWDGVWIATDKGHHQSLKKEIPDLSSFFIDNDERHGNWLMIMATAEDFEGSAIKVCEMISHGDPRIGRLTEKGPM